MYLNGSVWTKSKFLGMSIGVQLIGKGMKAYCLNPLISTLQLLFPTLSYRLPNSDFSTVKLTIFSSSNSLLSTPSSQYLTILHTAVQIHILEYGEVYDITLPSVYARSILTKPWVELGDKVNVTCAQNAYSASICFQTKVQL